jgi:hypothetical protein
MKGETIPDQDHIARLCQPKHIDEELIQASAFMLREDEESLSVNCMEFLNCSSRESEITEIRTVFSKKLHIGVRARLAVLNVGETRNKVLTESLDDRNLEVLHDPSTYDPSHSGIYNLKQDDDLIAELILETIQETYSARG